jgi:cytochrome c
MSRRSFASAFAALALLWSGASFGAEPFATAGDAKAMLDRAMAALKANEAAALKQFNDEKNKQFRDRDLYVYCFNIADGKFTAFQNDMMIGVDIRELKLPPDDPIGKRAYDAVHDAPEGNVVTIEYSFPKPGTKAAAIKQTLEARVGNQACGVTYFKS